MAILQQQMQVFQIGCSRGMEGRSPKLLRMGMSRTQKQRCCLFPTASNYRFPVLWLSRLYPETEWSINGCTAARTHKCVVCMFRVWLCKGHVWEHILFLMPVKELIHSNEAPKRCWCLGGTISWQYMHEYYVGCIYPQPWATSYKYNMPQSPLLSWIQLSSGQLLITLFIWACLQC